MERWFSASDRAKKKRGTVLDRHPSLITVTNLGRERAVLLDKLDDAVG